MEKPIMIIEKKAESTTNKIRLPKAIVEQWGNNFNMEIYQDKIVLKPNKEK